MKIPIIVEFTESSNASGTAMAQVSTDFTIYHLLSSFLQTLYRVSGFSSIETQRAEGKTYKCLQQIQTQQKYTIHVNDTA